MKKRLLSAFLVVILVLTNGSMVDCVYASGADISEQADDKTAKPKDKEEAEKSKEEQQVRETDTLVQEEDVIRQQEEAIPEEEKSAEETENASENKEAYPEESMKALEDEQLPAKEDTKVPESEEPSIDETMEALEDEKADEEKQMLSWAEYRKKYIPDYANLSKKEYIAKMAEYRVYRQKFLKTEDGADIEGAASSGGFENDYLEVAVSNSGQFTIGNKEGNPNYPSDNNEILLYGHPSPGTSETLIKVEDDEFLFQADTTSYTGNSAVAVMNISEYGISVIQKLTFCSSGNARFEDSVKIAYQVINNGSKNVKVGVRIMIDTMLANNDDAPFKITGHGNVTEITNYSGASVPVSYQVYDNLKNPTTIATGYLVNGSERKPDQVQFTNWGAIRGSGWDYIGNVGGYLGDSAVGIYFNPTGIPAGGSTQVSTYYGVGVGAAIGDAAHSDVLRSDQVGVEVKKAGAKEKVADADVKLSYSGQGTGHQEGRTDASGLVVLDGIPEQECEAQITVSKEGYKTRNTNAVIKGGTKVAVSLKSENDTTPIVETVTLDGKDILSQNRHFIENSNKTIEKSNSSKIKEITIKAAADMENCVYYLMQDTAVVQKNNTGEFKIKTVDTKSGTVIDKFKSGTKKYIKCVSQEGKSSQKMMLGIKVSIPSVSASTIMDTDFWPYGSANIASGTLGALLLGDKVSFGILKNHKPKMVIEVKENGLVQVGVNFKKMPQSSEDRKKIFDEMSKGALKTSTENKFIDQKRKISMGSVTPSVSFYGYGEGIIKNGEATVNIAIRVEGGIAASYTTNFYWVVPLYITVGAGGKISAEVKANIHNAEGWTFGVTSGTISPEVYLSLEGGVGSKGVASLGVEGKGTLNYTNNFVSQQSKATLTGTASLVGSIWKFEKRLKLAEASAKVYDSNDKEGTVYCEDSDNLAELFEKQEFKLMSRGHLSKTEDAEGASNSEGMEMAGNADAKPRIVNVGGTQYKFWLKDNTERQVSNGNMLVYSKNSGNGWTAEKAVEDDGTGDYDFNVAVDGNKIYVVWQDCTEVFDDNTVTVDQMAQSAEIKYAVIDTASSDAVTIKRITDNTVADMLPVAAVLNNNAYVAWYRKDGDILSNENNGYLEYVKISADNVGTENQIDLGKNDVSQIIADVSGSKAYVYVTQSDQIISIDNYNDVTNKTTTYCMSDTDKTGTEFKKNIGTIVNSSLNGEATMFWLEAGNICYKNSRTGKVFADSEQAAGLSGDYAIADGKDKTYLIWTGADAGNGQKRIWSVCYDGTKWGTPYIAAESEYDEIRNLTANVEDGKLTLSYVGLYYDSEGAVERSQLVHKAAEDRTDIELTDVEYDENAVEKGANLPLSLNVRNNGNTEVKGCTIRISGTYDDSYVKEISDISIPAGSSETIKVDDYAVSADIPEDEVDECVIAAEVSGDENEDNNKTAVSLGYAQIITENESRVILDNEEYYKFRLENVGRIDAESVKVKILADEIDGALIYDEDFGLVKGGEKKYFYVASRNFENCSQAYSYISSVTPQDNKGAEYNLISCSDETVMLLSESELVVEAETGGSIIEGQSGTYSSFEEIPVRAEAQDGYVFNGWEYENGYMEDPDNISAVYTVGESGNDTLRATFIADTVTESIKLSSNTLNLNIGQNSRLSANVLPETNKKQVIWESSDESVVTVDGKGKVTALAEGTATVKVKDKKNAEIYDECTITVDRAKTESIRMVYPEFELPKIGSTDILDVIVEPESAENSLIWSSSDESIISVEQDGTITAKGLGTAVITVTAPDDSTIKATSKVVVKAPLESIKISEQTLTMNKGDKKEVSVIYNPQNTTDDKNVTWLNYADSVVSIEPDGADSEKLKITALDGGTALIAAEVNGMTAYTAINVEIPITAIEMDASITMEEGESYPIDYSTEPYDATETLTWTSSNPDVAEVSSGGYVYANKPGTAVITAAASKIRKTCTVTVTQQRYDITNVTGINGFESSHPYTNNLNKVWQYVAEGAKQITLTFSESCNLENGCDYVYIMDKNNEMIKEFTGSELAGQTVTVQGSVVRVRLKTDGSVTKYGFKVTNIQIAYNYNNASIDPIPNQSYTGKALTPKPVVRINGAVISSGYKVTYKNNVHVGIGTVTVTAIAPGSGEVSAQFAIRLPSLKKVTSLKQKSGKSKTVTLSWKKVKSAKGYYIYKYNTKSKKYVLYKTLKGASKTSITIKKLKSNKKYKYAVAAFCNDGKNKTTSAKKYITAATGTKAPSIKVKSSAKKTIAVSWKKVSGANGYEIYVASKKKGTFKKKITVGKGSKTKATLKKLKKGKKYYVKVRTYKKTKSGKIYSDFSKVASVKVK